MLRRFTPFVCAVFICILLTAFPAYAEGTAEEESSPSADTPILVAGCYDCDPIEYYDSTEDKYVGIMPDILARISEQTGMTFQYVGSSTGDNREDLIKNPQVKIVSAVKDYDEFGLQKTEQGLEYEVDGATHQAYFAFTEAAEPELIQSFNEAFEEVLRSDDMNRILMKYAVQGRQEKTSGWLVALVTAQTSIELVDVRHAASSPAYVHSRVDGEREEHARVRAPVLERHTADKLYSLTLAHAARRGVCVLAGNHDCAVLPTTAYRRLGIDL
ncbi:MAG TPA: hypothetical protein PKV62_07600, partial [Oscillospiraceae bacterium]|nr:hypothetical protein [Oscillospiraceae bacterium]